MGAFDGSYLFDPLERFLVANMGAKASFDMENMLPNAKVQPKEVSKWEFNQINVSYLLGVEARRCVGASKGV